MKYLRAVPFPTVALDKLLRRPIGAPVLAFSLQDFTWMLQLDGGWMVASEGRWRLLDAAGVKATDQDHGQQFGLPEAFDAQREVEVLLGGQCLRTAIVSRPSSDLILEFDGGHSLQWLVHSCGYEAWRLQGPDVDLMCNSNGVHTFEAFDPPPGWPPMPPIAT